MPYAIYAVRPGDLAHGTICPDCADPKTPQAKRCRACYTDDQRAASSRAEDPRDRCACESPKDRYFTRCFACYVAARRRGEAGPRGRSQSQSHPWRKAEALRLRGAV